MPIRCVSTVPQHHQQRNSSCEPTQPGNLHGPHASLWLLLLLLLQATATGPGLWSCQQRRCHRSCRSRAWVSTLRVMAWHARTGWHWWLCTQMHGSWQWRSSMQSNWTPTAGVQLQQVQHHQHVLGDG